MPGAWQRLGHNMAVCQNLVPLVNIKIAGKWMFIPLKMVLIGIDPYPHGNIFPGWQKYPVKSWFLWFLVLDLFNFVHFFGGPYGVFLMTAGFI